MTLRAQHWEGADETFGRAWAAELIAADETPVQRVEIAGAGGHLHGVLSLAQVGDAIASFLEE